MKKYKFWIKFIAGVTALLFTFNNATFVDEARALSPWLALQSPPVRRKIQTELAITRILDRTCVMYADSNEALCLLGIRHADAILLSSGKYLISKDVSKDDLRLLRVLNNLEIKAFMQVLCKYDRYRYNGIKDLILYSGILDTYKNLIYTDRKPDVPLELLINDIVAKIFEFELLDMIDPDFFQKYKITPQERVFMEAVKKTGILNNRHSYFMADFRDAGKRGDKIKAALDDKFRFQEAAYTNPTVKAQSVILNILADAIMNNKNKEKEEVLKYFKTLVQRPSTIAEELVSGLEDYLDFSSELPVQININLAVLYLLAELPDRYKSWDMAVKVSRILCYKGQYRDKLRMAGKCFFESIPDDLVFDYFQVVTVDDAEFWKENRRSPDFIQKLFYKDIEEKPLLKPLGEIKLGALIRLKGMESAETEKNIFVESNLRLVISQVKRYFWWTNLPFLDLVSAGNIGLMKAVKKFEPWRGRKFSTYASWWIRQAVRRHIETHRRDIRIAENIQRDIKRFREACKEAKIDLHDKRLDNSYIAEKIGYKPKDVDKLREAMFTIVSLQDPYENGDNKIEETMIPTNGDYEEREQHMMQEKMGVIIDDIREEVIKELKKDYFDEKGLKLAIDVLDKRIIPESSGKESVSLRKLTQEHSVNDAAVPYAVRKVKKIFKEVAQGKNENGENEIREKVVAILTKRYIKKEQVDRCIDILDRYIIPLIAETEGVTLEELGEEQNLTREMIRQYKDKVLVILNEVAGRWHINIGDYSSEGSPGEALLTIYKNFGFSEFNKKALYPLRKKNGKQLKKQEGKELYAPSTVDTEVSILKKLGILIPVKKAIYRLNRVFEGSDDMETEDNIAAVYNIEFRVGKDKRTDRPFECFKIPAEKIPAVKERVKMGLAHIWHKKALETDTQKKIYTIKVWEGYAAPVQSGGMLTRIRKMYGKGSYRVEFERLDKLMEFACKEGTKDDAVTILPHNRLDNKQRERLQDSKAHVIYMDFKEEILDAACIVQLEGIIAAGIAYLNDNETAFKKLYRILTDEDIQISIKELKNNPVLAVNHIFKLKKPEKLDIDDLKRLNNKMEEFLMSP